MNILLRFRSALVTFFFLISWGHIASAEEFTGKDLNNEAILALTWVQTAAEYKALTHQAFNIARLRWDMDKGAGKKAVVVDLDETVIDNSAFNAGLIGKDFGYSNAAWKKWCEAEEALAIPGAVDFLKHVVATGGDVFYISNRKAQPEHEMDLSKATMNNLKALGLPHVDKEHLLLRTGSPDKQPRRNIVTDKGYRIVLLIGDNLNDFSNLFSAESFTDRALLVEAQKEKFGDTFIILPNPVYGAWESAVYADKQWYKKSPKELSDIRIQTLRKFDFSK